MPVDYKNGKVYKLSCPDGHYYIGSTASELSTRLSQHKHAITNKTHGGTYTYFQKIPVAEITIELIEDSPCESKKELNEYEDYFIELAMEDSLCLNSRRSYRTEEYIKKYDKTYYEENKEHIASMCREYYEKNKEKILEYHKKYTKENKDKIITYKKKYRKENAEAIADYNKKYVAEHVEEVKEARKTHYEENKEATLASNRLYVETHKEAVEDYKKKWAREKYAKLAPAKKAARDAKTAARIARDKMIITCECGGTYEKCRRGRHVESKKHLKFLTPL